MLKAMLLARAGRAQSRCREEFLRRLAAGRGGPRLSIAVATLHTAEIRAYSETVCAINRSYCARHGYDFCEFRELLDRDAAPTWNKPAVLSRLLAGGRHYDYVMWIDADAAFNNHDVALADLLHLAPDHDLLISLDPPNAIPRQSCAGVFIVKNTFWSRQFLVRWLAAGQSMRKGKYFDKRRRGKKDQEILNRLLRLPEQAGHVKVLPSCWLNEDPNLPASEAGFILHAMASSAGERRTLFAGLYARLSAPPGGPAAAGAPLVASRT
jgi:hypothetical protein